MGAPMSTTKPVDNPADAFLQPNDPIGVSFWIISIAMIASTVFFFSEASTVNSHWKSSLHVGGLVTLVAGVHYMYMREYWVQVHGSPIVYRYVDWSITVPLQMIEFYLILSAVQPKIGTGMFYRLLLGTVVMLAFGYAGEVGFLPAIVGFVFGMCGWAYILHEVGVDFQQYVDAEKVAALKEKVHPTVHEYAAKIHDQLKKTGVGEAGSVIACTEGIDEDVQRSYKTMRFIVTVGWSIYPLGYFFGYLMGAVQDDVLNLLYNIADFINKIAFCLAIWDCAKKNTKRSEDNEAGMC